MLWLPNILTLSRILAVPLLVGLLWPAEQGHEWRIGYIAAFGLYCLMGITDYFDGYLARAKGTVSRLGIFLDPIADKIMVAAVIIMLVSTRHEAAAIQAVYTSPATMLGRVGLGDPKRTQYQLQLEGAGPVEMETAARTAIMTGDLVLGAAIATVIDRRPKDRRPFAVQAFAERVVGEVWKRMTAKLEGVQLAYKSAVAADREFVRGKADGITNLSLALSQQAITEAEASAT